MTSIYSHAPAPMGNNVNPSAQAHLQVSLNALNAKIVQAQSLAMANGLSVDDVLARMGGLNEMELGLLQLCAAREQEARLQANLMMHQQQAMLQSQKQNQNTRTRSPGEVYNSAQEQRNAARQSVEQSLRTRKGRDPAVRTSTHAGWEAGFENLSIRGEDRGYPARGTSGTRTATAPGTFQNSSAPRGESSTRRVSPTAVSSAAASGTSTPVAPPQSAKHAQAATWRASGRFQMPTAPAQTILPQKHTSTASINNGEKAITGFNGVFGNRLMGNDNRTHRSTRSGSTSSLEESVTLSPKRGREATVTSSTSSCDTADTCIVTPIADERVRTDGYFGIKPTFTPPPTFGVGKDNAYQYHQLAPTMSRSSVASSADGAAGVIGQGYKAFPAVTSAGNFSSVIRQPFGPPGGADELGSKNFATRLRQKAVSDLSLLGRRKAQSPHTEY